MEAGAHSATCPLTALRAWLDGAALQDGALFRAIRPDGRLSNRALSDREICRIVQRAACRVGLTSVSGHSLRCGLVTEAALAGATERQIATVTGHRCLATVRRYIRGSASIRPELTRRIGL